jgi:dTDP-L-rhamnose 4-epimerase
MSSESVLITGGTGLIGSHLARDLAQAGHAVRIIGRSHRFMVSDTMPKDAADRIDVVGGDVCDPETLEELLRKSDVVFHKSESGGMFGAVESARGYVAEHLVATANLVDVLRKLGGNTKKVILDSSVSVYGEGNYTCRQCGTVRPALRQSINGNWDPPCPRCGGVIEPTLTPESADRNGDSVYAITRKAQEDLLISTCRQLSIPLTVLRYSTVLGPGQSWHNPFTRVLEMLASGESPVVHEDGLQTREFIFIDDLVRANILALQHTTGPTDIVNVSAVHLPLLEFVQLLGKAMAEALGKEKVEPLVDGRLIAGDVRHCWVDLSKLKEEWQFTPRQNLEEEIAALVRWFVEFKGLAPKKQTTNRS